jgi:hypothetical protein
MRYIIIYQCPVRKEAAALLTLKDRINSKQCIKEASI